MIDHCCESTEEKTHRKTRENVKELIFIILTLLLSLAFITGYDVEHQKEAGQSVHIPFEINLLFILGIFILIIAFFQYMLNNKNWRLILYIILFCFVAIFAVIFLKSFLDGLNDSIKDIVVSDERRDLFENLNLLSEIIFSSLILNISFLIIYILGIIWISIEIEIGMNLTQQTPHHN